MARRRPTDDRGEPCGIAGLSARHIGWRSVGVQKWIRDADARAEQKITEGLEIGVALVGAFVGYALWEFSAGTLLKPFISPLLRITIATTFAVVFSMLVWWAMLDRIRARRFGRISTIYLSSWRCAACGYELRGLGPEGDGCVVCPECRAAWRRGRLGGDDGDEEHHTDG